MTATITDRNPSITWGHSGDHVARYRAEDPRLLSDPFAKGTLWERLADDETNRTDWCPVCERVTVYAVEVCQSCGRVWGYDAPRENIPQRVERIMRDHNASPRAALRVALAESRLERAKAAHPAGKGIKQEEGTK